jgi:hypothetical protein
VNGSDKTPQTAAKRGVTGRFFREERMESITSWVRLVEIVFSPILSG